MYPSAPADSADTGTQSQQRVVELTQVVHMAGRHRSQALTTANRTSVVSVQILVPVHCIIELRLRDTGSE